MVGVPVGRATLRGIYIKLRREENRENEEKKKNLNIYTDVNITARKEGT